MSIFTSPPRTTKYSFRRGDVHLGVFALQRFLNTIYGGLSEDGAFGEKTEAAVERYQRAVGAGVDGVVGPETQARIVRSCVVRAPRGSLLPKGLIEGQIDAESGRLLGAVNAQVAGGLDLGLTQRRVYGPPFASESVKRAMDPIASVALSVNELVERYEVYSQRLGKGEYAWRVAALAHNWPWAANELSLGRALSASKQATWAPRGLKFPDGQPVYSYRDWAQFYAIGSKAHRHAGLVTKLAFGVPTR